MGSKAVPTHLSPSNVRVVFRAMSPDQAALARAHARHMELEARSPEHRTLTSVLTVSGQPEGHRACLRLVLDGTQYEAVGEAETAAQAVDRAYDSLVLDEPLGSLHLACEGVLAFLAPAPALAS